MDTITISKKEYQTLLNKTLKYEYLSSIIKNDDDICGSPPFKNSKKVVSEFRKTGLYSKKFLSSLERGLARSLFRFLAP